MKRKAAIKGGGGQRSVKVSSETYDKLRGIIDQVAREGWQSFEAGRHDRATFATVVDAAADRLLGSARGER